MTAEDELLSVARRVADLDPDDHVSTKADIEEIMRRGPRQSAEATERVYRRILESHAAEIVSPKARRDYHL